MTILIVIAILVLLIVTHELGHFLAAKYFGVKVEEFGVGYPPRAFIFGKWDGTEYTLNWIPFGGFVRLYGEDAADRGAGSLAGAARWKQAIILVAGVTANALVAWLLFSAALYVGVPQVINEPKPGESVQLIVSDVVAGSPAGAAGLIPGDTITKIEDIKGELPKSLTPDGVMQFVSAHGGQRINVTYERAHVSDTLTIRPANAVVPGAEGRPALGIGLAMVGTRSLPALEALSVGFRTTINAFWYVGESLWTMLSQFAIGRGNLTDVVGPVGLVGVIGEATQNGVGYVLQLAAFIGVNLAIINLIPIPALDGGRLVIVGIEALMRKRAPKLAVQTLNTVGIALVILLMITVTYHDIARLFA